MKVMRPKELVRDALLAFLTGDSKLHARLENLQTEIDRGLKDIGQGRFGKLNKDAIKRLGRRRLSFRVG